MKGLQSLRDMGTDHDITNLSPRVQHWTKKLHLLINLVNVS